MRYLLEVKSLFGDGRGPEGELADHITGTSETPNLGLRISD